MDSVLLSKQCRLISPGHFATAVLGLLTVLAITGCGEASRAVYRPTATVEELMRTMIDPPADAVWDSVVTEATTNGIIEIRPETEEDWFRLRRHAITLAEATNLLVVPSRRVAGPDARSELPGIDLHPDAIQQLLTENWASWVAAVQMLRMTSRTLIDAIDNQDIDALLIAGTELDLACENCHSQFWYPDQDDPRPAPSPKP